MFTFAKIIISRELYDIVNASHFIAHRLGRTASARGAMTHIAATAVAVSVAVMILALGVVFGFRREMTALISRMAAEATVTDPRSLRSAESLPIGDTPHLREVIALAAEQVVEDARVEAYATCGGVIRAEGGAAGVLLKGVESADGVRAFAGNMEAGDLPRFEPTRHKEIMLPSSCARALGTEVGKRVELLFMEEGGERRREIFRVCGIYSATMNDGRVAVALTDMRNVRKINGWTEGQISGYEVRTADFDRADALAEAINDALITRYDGDENIAALSAPMLYDDVFNWLGTHDVNATVIITIMFVVALFNMITALLILILEQTRSIGILKTLGMNNRDLRRIFIERSAAIVVRGTLWGNAVGIGLALLQHFTHVIALDAEGYGVSAVPVELGAGWIAALDCGFVAAIVLLSAAATTIVARIRPSETIRYE